MNCFPQQHEFGERLDRLTGSLSRVRVSFLPFICVSAEASAAKDNLARWPFRLRHKIVLPTWHCLVTLYHYFEAHKEVTCHTRTGGLGARRVKSQEATCAFGGWLLRSKRLIPEAGKQDRATAI